jgi:hypothetical protein
MPHDVMREGESSTGDPHSIEGVDQPEAGPSIPRKRLAEVDVEGSMTRRTRGKKVDYKHLNDPFSDEEVMSAEQITNLREMMMTSQLWNRLDDLLSGLSGSAQSNLS